MAFMPEDGTGLATSNSYASVAFADEYFADRGVTSWLSLAEPAKQSSLIAATDYIDTRFGHYLKGRRAVPDTQACEFPRDYLAGEVPVNVKKATAEYAIRASLAPLAPDLDVDVSGFQISERLEQVGPIQEKISFATIGSGSVRMLLKPYPAADMLMRAFIRTHNGSVIRN